MLSMLRPMNIELSNDQYSVKRRMDFGKSSLSNISVKKQEQDFSLKKNTATYSKATSDNDSIDDLSEKSNEDEVTKTFAFKESEDDEQKPSLIKIDDVKSYDILCGRDKATFNNVGNRRFRVLISLNIPRYEMATTKAEKAIVIKYICDVFRNEVGVRFLKKHKTGEGYYELSVSEARKKVGHALRDMSVARQELEKKREAKKRKFQKQQSDYHESRRTSIGQDFEQLEPLPINDQQAFVEPLVHAESKHHNRPWLDQPAPKQHTTIPDIIAKQLESAQTHAHDQSNSRQQFSTLQEKLLDLQRQQQQLQNEQEALLRQQQYQQEILELQIRNRRLRRQQEQIQQIQQQRQQRQQRQSQDGDAFNPFEKFFDKRQR